MEIQEGTLSFISAEREPIHRLCFPIIHGLAPSRSSTSRKWVECLLNRDEFLHAVSGLRSHISFYIFVSLLGLQYNTIISGMTSSLLESVFIPGPKSDAKQLYNITLVEKLLRILYASCQYGEGTCYLYGDMRFSHRLPQRRSMCS